jgi:hypothetical protein
MVLAMTRKMRGREAAGVLKEVSTRSSPAAALVVTLQRNPQASQ